MSSLMRLIVFFMARRSVFAPKPPRGVDEGSTCSSCSRMCRNSAKAHSESVPPFTNRYHLSSNELASGRLTYFQAPIPPLCIHIKVLCWKGWQLYSANEPSVLALTWAKTSRECIFGASRSRLAQFHAGSVEVKIHGSGPSSGSVYHPIPKPSPL